MSTGDVINPVVLHPPSEPNRCDCADYLRRVAPWQTFLTSDVRRGFLSAARTLDQRPVRDLSTAE